MNEEKRKKAGVKGKRRGCIPKITWSIVHVLMHADAERTAGLFCLPIETKIINNIKYFNTCKNGELSLSMGSKVRLAF